MRQDILTKQVIDRRNGGTVTYKMERGVAGELLFLISGGSWNYKDIITAKLRHSGGVDVIIDRMPALLLAWLCDTKKGRPSIGTYNSAGVAGEELLNETTINTGQAFFVNAFKVPLGHITLADAKSELEITVELAKGFGQLSTVKIANVEPKAGPDYLLQYDRSNDLESTHNLVRELWIYGRNGVALFKGFGTVGQVLGLDINLMLYPSVDGAYETDVEVLGANTSIDGQLSHSVNNLVCAFQDNDSLPTPSLRVKVSGDDAATCGLFFIKEKMIQAMTSVSTIAQVEKILVKTEAIEKMDSSAAKAYRHAGSTRHSSELAQMKAEVEAKTPEAK